MNHFTSSRRWLFARCCLAAIGCLFFVGKFAHAERPNIVFFLVDDMGWQETSVPFGPETTELNRRYETPSMERLARQSVLFTNAYACAICSPTRVSWMTGQNAARHRVTCWTLRKNKSPEAAKRGLVPTQWNVNGLQPVGAGVDRSFEAKTLVMRLQEAGYKTIHAGKAHWGAQGTPGANPVNLGFDVNIAGSYMGGPGSYYGEENFSAAHRGGGHIWDIPGLEKYHGREINLTEAITREVVAELHRTFADDNDNAADNENADDRPFFLYLSHYAVHAPWEPDRRFIDKYRGREGWSEQQSVLASMLASMDRSLGDVLDTLESLGVADNTIVVFMSDNGSPGKNPRNLPLRGHKISAYEGGARVPMMVRVPGVTKETQRTNTPVIIEDLFPTILDWAGVDCPEDIDGESIAHVVRNPNQPPSNPRPLFWHYPNLYHRPPFSSVRLGNDKLIYFHHTQKLELYDLSSDLGEQRNLADERPERRDQLAKLLGDYLRDVDAQMPIVEATGEAVAWPDEAS